MITSNELNGMLSYTTMVMTLDANPIYDYEYASEDDELDAIGYEHNCGEWADECMDGFCDFAINPCSTHYEEACVEGCAFTD